MMKRPHATHLHDMTELRVHAAHNGVQPTVVLSQLLPVVSYDIA